MLSSALTQTQCTLVACDFYCVYSLHQSGVLLVLLYCYMTVPCETAAISVHTIQPYTSLQCNNIWSYTHRVQMCLAVTGHLHFGQNDRVLLHATIQGWNRYQNKSQHRKLTMENKILLQLLPGLEPKTFQSESSALPLSYPCLHNCEMASSITKTSKSNYPLNTSVKT